MDVKEDTIITGSVKEITVVQNGRKVSTLPVNYEPSCVAINPNNSDVAIGGAVDNKVHIYTLTGSNLSPKTELEHLGALTDCSYSPCGEYLVACDAYRKVILYKSSDYQVRVKKFCYMIKQKIF